MTTQTPLAPWNSAAFLEAGNAAERLASRLRYAALAPSGHDTQRWLLGVSGVSVDLYADRRQALPVGALARAWRPHTRRARRSTRLSASARLDPPPATPPRSLGSRRRDLLEERAT